MTVVHLNLYDPRNSLFKQKDSEKAEVQYVDCSCNECPLLKNGYCAATRFLGSCVYGKYRRETGYTKRARNYSKWIAEKREEFKGIPYLQSPPIKMALIGDYVYLPYAHMNNVDSPGQFGQKSSIFYFGSDFLHKEHWNIKTVISLINFKPQALFGGEITSYQKEQVPLFIQHIKEVDLDMWRQLIEVRPDLDKTPNYVGRVAKLKTLNHPIKITISNNQYEWTGKELVCRQVDALSRDYRSDADSCEIRIVPKDGAEIKVESNDWVNENTEFVN